MKPMDKLQIIILLAVLWTCLYCMISEDVRPFYIILNVLFVVICVLSIVAIVLFAYISLLLFYYGLLDLINWGKQQYKHIKNL